MKEEIILMEEKENNSKCIICGKEFYSKWDIRITCSSECQKKYRSTDEYKKNISEKMKEANKRINEDTAKRELRENKRKNTCLERYGVVSPTLVPEIRKKQEQTNIEKYGDISPSRNKDVLEKIKKSMVENHGVEFPLQNKEIFNKMKNTMLENHGVEFALQSQEFVDKSKETKLERYGNENYFNEEKSKQTCLDRYGVPFISQVKAFREKSIKTCLEKYGVDNPAKSDEIKEKTIKGNLEKYGTKYPISNNVIRKKRDDKYFSNYYNNELLNKCNLCNIVPLFTEKEYEGNVSYQKMYSFLCKTCNSKFEDSLMGSRLPRCTTCYPPQTSKVQIDVYNYIKSIIPNEPVNKNIRKIIKPLELDIFIPSKNIAIEFDGLYWHSEIGGKKYKNYHINKTNKCSKLGIKLIHIFENEWTDKQEIVKNKIKHIIGKDDNKSIYARKCIIKEIDYNTTSVFLDTYHIQGKDNSLIRLGAYYNNELISVMTFGSLRRALGNRNIKKGEYEMYRFCISNYKIVGIGGKLLSYFIKTYNPTKIISYADRRWSDQSAFYSKIGFNFVKITQPNYWYIGDKYMHTYYRFGFRKSELPKKLKKFDPNLTEWENMQLNGFDRIWDCGNLKYEWKPN